MINKFKSPLGMTEFVFNKQQIFSFVKYFFFLNANLSAEIMCFFIVLRCFDHKYKSFLHRMYPLPKRLIFQLRQQLFSHSACVAIIRHFADGDEILSQGCSTACEQRHFLENPCGCTDHPHRHHPWSVCPPLLRRLIQKLLERLNPFVAKMIYS